MHVCVGRDCELCLVCLPSRRIPYKLHTDNYHTYPFNAKTSSYRSFSDRTLPPIPSVAVVHFHLPKMPLPHRTLLCWYYPTELEVPSQTIWVKAKQYIPTVAVTRTLSSQRYYMSLCSAVWVVDMQTEKLQRRVVLAAVSSRNRIGSIGCSKFF